MRLAILAVSFGLVVTGSTTVGIVAQEDTAKPVVEVYKSPT